MISCQDFPETVEEFMEEYKMVDTEEVYSNGTEFVPIFRMNQWLEHEKSKHGKWLPLFNGEYTGGAYWFECSECKTVVSGGLQSGNRFCKGCGARMEE